MALRKLDLMHKMFGKADEGCKCKDCKYFKSYKHHDYRYRKCAIYGVTCSEGSDWTGKWQACGLFPDKPTEHENIIKLVHGGKEKQDIQIEGQISFENWINSG